MCIRDREVLAAAKAGGPDEKTLHHRMFYANLYIGLFYEAINEPTKAREYILAADKLPIGHYMWNVAHVHAERLRKTDAKPTTAEPTTAEPTAAQQ